MKIALAQINTRIGAFDSNLSKVLEALEKAKLQKADLIVFPELTLTGYPPKDLLERKDFLQASESCLKKVIPATKNICVLIGFAENNRESKGRMAFNSVALIQNKKLISIYRKQLLPNYDVFDEARYFEAGKNTGLFHFQNQKVGISICEDLWASYSGFDRPLYSFDPIALQIQGGAKVLINLSASPAHLGKIKEREKLLSNLARKHRKPFIYLNLVGGNDDLIFDGSSLVFNAKGQICEKLKSFEEDFVVCDLKEIKPKKINREPEEQWLKKALVLGIRDYLKKTGFQKVVLGLSGGIDSALVLALAVEACGASNVLALAMPSPFSSKHSVSDAIDLSKKLNVELRILPIQNLFEQFQVDLKWSANKQKTKVDLALQNLQSRIRGNLLMAISNRENYLLLSTGNKSEMAVGYCTLYGDMSGGLAVISDLPKKWVYRLSQYINRNEQIIPTSILKKAPSAELAPGQKDQDDLPDYDVLDAIVERYVEKNQSIQKIIDAGFSKKVVLDIVRRIHQNEYKRRQAPLGLRITSKAFGSGRRVPITHGFEG
ncbi:MAG: NAD+ synthase [Deltaproteobacteria bacterium]|nr:NAD+ synthase [Deltaproteobacteria bacterium]